MWHLTKLELPENGRDVLIKLNNGEVHEGRFIKDINKYHMNINRFKIYKTGKTVHMDDVDMWKDMPIIGFVAAANN